MAKRSSHSFSSLRTVRGTFFVSWCFLLGLSAVTQAQPAHLVFAAGKVELSPTKTLTRTAVSLPTDQLVGVAPGGWAIVETRHDACQGRGDGPSMPAKHRWILGPGAIHTVDGNTAPCEVSSERRLRQVFDGLATCSSDCAYTVTVASDGDGLATEALFLELLQASRLAKVEPRDTDGLGLTEKVASAAPSLCERYAASAVAQQVENVTKGCGMSGSGWSDEPAGHIRFCEQVGKKQAELERRRASRRRVLERCSPRSLSPECAEYAAGAAALQDGNLFYGCGFEGRDWSADFDTHYEWCTTATNRELRLQVLGLRQAKVKACAER